MTEHRDRSEEDSGSVKDRLLRCAAELFAKRGYAATTVREIVEAAGVTKPVLYYYFESKEGLFLEMLRGPAERFMNLMTVIQAAQGTPREKLLTILDQVYSLFTSDLELMRIVHSIYYGPPQGAPQVDMDAYHFSFVEAVQNLVAEGYRTGDFVKGEVREVAWALLGCWHLATEFKLCNPDQGLDREALGRVLNLILDAVEAKSN